MKNKLAVREGSIIEVISLTDESSWYQDWIKGTLPLIYRVGKYSLVDECGLIDVHPIPPANSLDTARSIFKAKYKVLWY